MNPVAPHARKRTRFPGITADARALGVNRATLYKMLVGYPGFAELRGLRRRYDALSARVPATKEGGRMEQRQGDSRHGGTGT